MTEPWDLEDMPDEPITPTHRTGELTKLIDNFLATNADNEIRPYIGASSVGHPCERKIWYGYKGIDGTPNDPQTQRTFDIGKELEELVLYYLEAAGFDIDTRLDTFKDNEVPELQGHCDAILYWGVDHSVPSIIEIKTARDASFNVFVKHGLKKWYPIYYAQVQAYMGMSGIHEAYVIALNKDTSKLHDEYVAFDKIYYEELKMKANRIARLEEAPERINKNPSYFTCRMCSYKELCHG